MRTTTYWVSYIYSYEYWDEEEQKWNSEEMVDSERFKGPKRSIRKTVEETICKELDGETYRNLKIKVIDMYLTTDHEV